MNVLIVCLNSKYVHASPAPWYLSAGIKKYSKKEHNVSVCEATINENLNDITERIVAYKPDVVGFCCYIWNITQVLAVVKLLKNSFNAITVLGGPEVSYNAYEVLKNTSEIDYIISGEGELPFALLCDALSLNKDAENILGLCYRKNIDIIVNEPFISNETPPFFVDEYSENIKNRIAYTETTRGCPFSCAFCLSGRCGNVREFELQCCFENILKLSDKGAKIIKFIDRTFNANRTRSKAILRFITENYGKSIPYGTCFHFEIAGDILDTETIEILNSAPENIFFLEIGMQSFNEETLKSVNRKTDTKKLISNILALTSRKNVHTHIDLIAGLPLEDISSFAKSFDIGFSLNADVMQLGFLKLLHGAQMRENSNDFPCEYSNEPPYEVISTPWLSKFDISLIKSCEASLERLVNSGRFKRTCEYLFEDLKLDPFGTLTNLGVFTGIHSMPLYEYVNCLYLYFYTLCDKEKLRDILLCDVLTAAKMEKIPSLLIIKDIRLKKFKNYLESNNDLKREKGIKRTVFLLYSENCGAYIDYLPNEIPVINKIPFDNFLN